MEFWYQMRPELPDILSAHTHGTFNEPPLNDYGLPRADARPSLNSHRPFEYFHSYLDEEDASDWHQDRSQHSPEYDAWFQSSHQPYCGSQQWGGRLFDQGPQDHSAWVGDSGAASPLYDPLQQDFDRQEPMNRPYSPFPLPFRGPFAACYQRRCPDTWSPFDRYRRFALFEGNEAREGVTAYDDQKFPAYNVEEPSKTNIHPLTGFPQRQKSRGQYRIHYERHSKSSDWGPLNKDGRARMPPPGYCWTVNQSSQSTPRSPNSSASHTPECRSYLSPDAGIHSPVPERQPDHEPCSQDPLDRTGRDGNSCAISRIQQDLKWGKELLDEFMAVVRGLERRAEELGIRVSRLEELEARSGGQT
ncbi:MAG: hypothetical protein L6R41_005548 [Letrouitia leprolyta]|nr:MAG: hypothetical protein L6R41_005548 [Letrouitia leprolyta]